MSPVVSIDHPESLSLRAIMQNPAPSHQHHDRIVVSKWGFEVATAYNFDYEAVPCGDALGEAIRFEIRLNDVLLTMVGSLLTYYATFAHADVEIRPRYDVGGRFGVTATVTPRKVGTTAETLNAVAARLPDGSTRFTLTDPRWNGQSVTLHPGRGSMEVIGVLSRSHRLTGRYARKRR